MGNLGFTLTNKIENARLAKYKIAFSPYALMAKPYFTAHN